jgi:hypothetical protein
MDSSNGQEANKPGLSVPLHSVIVSNQPSSSTAATTASSHPSSSYNNTINTTTSNSSNSAPKHLPSKIVLNTNRDDLHLDDNASDATSLVSPSPRLSSHTPQLQNPMVPAISTTDFIRSQMSNNFHHQPHLYNSASTPLSPAVSSSMAIPNLDPQAPLFIAIEQAVQRAFESQRSANGLSKGTDVSLRLDTLEGLVSRMGNQMETMVSAFAKVEQHLGSVPSLTSSSSSGGASFSGTKDTKDLDDVVRRLEVLETQVSAQVEKQSRAMLGFAERVGAVLDVYEKAERDAEGQQKLVSPQAGMPGMGGGEEIVAKLDDLGKKLDSVVFSSSSKEERYMKALESLAGRIQDILNVYETASDGSSGGGTTNRDIGVVSNEGSGGGDVTKYTTALENFVSRIQEVLTLHDQVATTANSTTSISSGPLDLVGLRNEIASLHSKLDNLQSSSTRNPKEEDRFTKAIDNLTSKIQEILATYDLQSQNGAMSPTRSAPSGGQASGAEMQDRYTVALENFVGRIQKVLEVHDELLAQTQPSITSPTTISRNVNGNAGLGGDNDVMESLHQKIDAFKRDLDSSLQTINIFATTLQSTDNDNNPSTISDDLANRLSTMESLMKTLPAPPPKSPLSPRLPNPKLEKLETLLESFPAVLKFELHKALDSHTEVMQALMKITVETGLERDREERRESVQFSTTSYHFPTTPSGGHSSGNSGGVAGVAGGVAGFVSGIMGGGSGASGHIPKLSKPGSSNSLQDRDHYQSPLPPTPHTTQTPSAGPGYHQEPTSIQGGAERRGRQGSMTALQNLGIFGSIWNSGGGHQQQQGGGGDGHGHVRANSGPGN